MQTLIDVILPVFLVIGAGYTMARTGYLREIHMDGLMQFALGFAIPCLLFLAIARLDLEGGIEPALLLSFYTSATVCFALGIIGARYLFGRDWEDSVAIGFICLYSNSVLLGLPITERAFGAGALAGNYAIIAVHAPYCYVLGVITMETVRNRGNGGQAILRAVFTATFRNVLLLAIALGFAVNVLNISLPGVATGALDLVARAGLPCALVAMGGVLSRYRPEGDLRVILWVTVISLGLHPTLTWLMGTTTGLGRDAFRSAVLTAAVGPGINAYIFASMYGRAMRVTASSVLLATAISILTLWVWLGVLP